jgi:hypothetical protein
MTRTTRTRPVTAESTKETKETKKYPASATFTRTALTPLTAAEDANLLVFAAGIALLFRRFGRDTLRNLARPAHPFHTIRYSPHAFRRWGRELEQLLHGAAPYDSPIAHYDFFLWMARMWAELCRVRNETEQDAREQGA